MNRVVFWGLCLTLILLPLPFGTVEEWSIFLFEGAVFILFTIHLVGGVYALKKGEMEEELPESKVPTFLKILLVVFLGTVIFQLIPIPSSLLKTLSPRALDIHHSLYSGGLNELEAGWKALSFSTSLSLYELISYVFYFLFGYLVFKHVQSRKEVVIFVHVLILGAVFQSFYGMAELFGGTERIFGYEKVVGLGSASGTFINRNHFSGFLEMIFLVSVGYLLAKADFFAMEKGFSLKEKVLWFSQERLQRCIVYGLMTIVIGIGIFFSRSRSGIFVFFATLFLMIIALSVSEGRREEGRLGNGRFIKRRFVMIIRTVTLIVLFAVILIGARPIIERFSWDELAEGAGRPVIFKNTVEIIENFPLFGTGLGTYVYAYGMFEKDSVGGIVVDHAHNDYLELVAESGVVGGVSLILFAFVAVGYIFVKWMKRRDYLVRGVVLGCIMGIVAILIHSLSDFNLHIPANAVYFVTLYALGSRVVNVRFED